MRKNLLAATAIALVASTGAAFAADLPSRKAAPVYVAPPPPPLWTGFYVGLNAGGTFGGSQSTNVGTYGLQSVVAGGGLAAASASALAGTGNFPVSNGGFIGGGQIGYNYQFYNNFLVGLEADIQGLAGGSSSASAATGAGVPGFPLNAVSGGVTTSKSLDYLGTVRGRIGYLVTPTLLLYGTGGLAYGGANSSTSVFQGISGPTFGITTAFGTAGSYSDTLVGWTAGAGLEWMFAPNWSAKLEYLYYDLGTVSYGSGALGSTFTGGGSFFTNVVGTTTKFDGHIVRAGVNYHFNWGAPAPVLAKY
jgi:outer membrane immunogenic protein